MKPGKSGNRQPSRSTRLSYIFGAHGRYAGAVNVHKEKGRPDRNTSRREFEPARRVRAAGRLPQRARPAQQAAGASDALLADANHDTDTLPQADGSPPRLDRAG